MKKFTFLFIAAVAAVSANAQTSWTYNADNIVLNPASANLGIGSSAMSNAKLRLYNYTPYSGTLYGLYSYSYNTYSGYGNSYGLYSSSYTGSSSTGVAYGLYSSSYGYNTSSTAGTYGLYSYAYKAGSAGTVYGIYSSVSGGSKRYAGYFSGGDVYVSGNVGIGVASPAAKLDVDGVGIFHKNLTINGCNSDGTTYPLSIVNPAKTGANQAHIWNIYSMSGDNYGNSLQFWAYGPDGADECSNGGLCGNRFTITDSGNVGIGTMHPTVKLDVTGTIRATEVKVCLNQGCDFVFEKNYKLMPLNDLSNFIFENRHLPEIAPAAEMESEGINLSEMNAKLLQKVEELTLYVIDLQQQINELKNK
ncbi:MAG: hypothetical protein LBC68_14870 [Prevotellaceae bacterium]|jgi:hypothetical protein|nr:hypothetical protein [Prevotellaceae bacterium]